MKRFLLFVTVAFVSVLPVLSQQDPVLMRVGDKEVTRSEFEYLFNKTNSFTPLEKQDLNEGLTRYVDYKLKVAEAEALGLDTVLAFRLELAGCRRELGSSFLMNEMVDEPVLRQLYDRYKTKWQKGQVRIRQIYKKIPQNASTPELQKVENRMDSLNSVLANNPSIDFIRLVQQFSDDKNETLINWLETPEEFEDVVFSLKKGEISKPFYTSAGLHIVMVTAVEDVKSFQEMEADMKKRFIKRYGVDKLKNTFIEKLKTAYNYVPDNAGVSELISSGKTVKVLFTLDGRPYSGLDFERFSENNPHDVRKQFDNFVVKSVLDYEDSRLEIKYPNFRMLMQEYRDGILLFEVSNREVWEKALHDQKGLEAYFNSHKKEYSWGMPKFKGVVLHCTSKKVTRQAKRLVKNLPMEYWSDIIQEYFNSGDRRLVKIEEGVYAQGENVYVDKIVFKKGRFTPPKSHPHTIALGNKLKAPENYEEVLEPLMNDYQNYLESVWISQLHRKFKVEINEEVLKTVNNHSSN